MLIGERGLSGAHALMLRSYAQWLNTLAPMDLIQETPQGPHAGEKYENICAWDWFTAQSVRALDMLNVRYIVARDTAPPYLEQSCVGSDPRFVRSGGDDFIEYENRRTLPAAYVVHDADTVPTLSDAISLIKDAGYSYRDRTVVT